MHLLCEFLEFLSGKSKTEMLRQLAQHDLQYGPILKEQQHPKGALRTSVHLILLLILYIRVNNGPFPH